MSSSDEDDDSDEQFPVAQSGWGAVRRDGHWKCFLLTSLICGCLGAVAWCRFTQVTKVVINLSLFPIARDRQASPCDEGYVYAPVALCACTLYLVYLVECWHCNARVQLLSSDPGCRLAVPAVRHRIRRMRRAHPLLWWKAVCYHYVRRKRQVTRYRNGDAYTSTQVYYERVNSHAAAGAFEHAYCGVRDISRRLRLDTQPRGRITKIRFSKGFAFANVEAAAEFEEQRSRFFAEHERYDDYMEMREGLDLADAVGLPPFPFRESVVAMVDPERAPWYACPAVYWISAFCLLSWPLRLVLEYNTAYVHYQVTKLFGVNYECGGGEPERGLTRSEDSGQLEWNVRENVAVVPSYSEALLIDSQHPQVRLPSVPASSYSVSSDARRSWAGVPSVPRSASSRTLYYASLLAENRPPDPYRHDEPPPPPPYDEALRLPTLGRLRRSLTELTATAQQRRDDADVIRAPHIRTLITMETSL